METQSTRSPALVTAPRMQGRRQAGLSASDRFWMVLGSVAGLALVPATGIALLSETAGPPQDRLPGLPETDPRESTAAQLRVLLQDAHQAADAPAPVAAAARPGSAQQKAKGGPAAESGADPETAHPPPEAHAEGGASGGSSGATPSARAGIGDPVLRHMPGAVRLDDTLVTATRQSADTAAPSDTVPQPGTPTLAPVLALGTDPDTWGIKTSYLIVSRPQDHILQTADGVLHMVINRGLGFGLTLVSSTDGGATWDTIYTFGPGNPLSTSDIRLIDGQDVMIVSYLDAGNDVAFAMLGYDSLTGAWTLLEQTVIDSTLDAPDTVHASIVLAPDGTLLIAYTDEVEGGLRLTLQQSTDGGLTWTETVLDQPGIPVGSARVLAAGQSEGIVYSNPEAMYWVTWDATGPGTWRSSTPPARSAPLPATSAP